MLLPLLALLAAAAAAVHAVCPHEDASALAWSDASSWPGGAVPAAGAAVTIDAGQVRLVDTSTAQLASVDVLGTLVLDNADVVLDAGWVRVQAGGKLLAGAADCRLTARTEVVLRGARTTLSDMGVDSDGQKIGAKGIAIMNGATVQLFGARPSVAWTTLAATAAAGATVLRLAEPVAWQAGDALVVTSTDFAGRDYAPEQTEFVDIAAVSADGRDVTLAAPLAFMHWGVGVEAAEVGLLTRHIVLRGDDDEASEFGGHLMVRDATVAQIDGVEFTRMGQFGVVGRYPCHFHLAGDHTGGETYVRFSSFHHNFQRCIAVHDTNGVVVEDNVAAQTNGHCYFLEDGSEIDTEWRRNLGALTFPVPASHEHQIIPSDSTPTVFWITNPANVFEDNVAASSVHGFWYALPEKPNGLSKAKYADTTTLWPRFTPLGVFKGNRAHSMDRMGLMVDDMQDDEGNIALGSYQPLVGPYTEGKPTWEYESSPALFEDFRAHHCRSHGVWTRGAGIRLSNLDLRDNQNGILLVPGPVDVRDAVIVGETDNIGTPESPGWLEPMPRSRPTYWTNAMPVIGLQMYDAGGPQFFSNVQLSGFHSNEFRPAGGIGVLRNGPNMLAAQDRVWDVTFADNSNRVYFESFPNAVDESTLELDGPNAVNLYDVDGSVTGHRGGWVVSDNDIMRYDACERVDEWNALRCPPMARNFVQLNLRNADTAATDFGETTTNGDHHRAEFLAVSDGASLMVTGGDVSNSVRDRYAANLRSHEAYTIRFPHETPPSIRLELRGAAHGDWLLFALPYPSGTTFAITRGWANTELQAVASPADVTMLSYAFVDEHLWIRLDLAESVVTELWGSALHESHPGYVNIQATCPGGGCTPSSVDLAVPTIPSADEDLYQGVECSATGSRVYVWFDAKASSMAYVAHVADGPVSLYIVDDAEAVGDTDGQFVLSLDGDASPVMGRSAVSRDVHVALFEGRLRARFGSATLALLCAGDCSPPAAMPQSNGCDQDVTGETVVSTVVDAGVLATDAWDIWSWEPAAYDTEVVAAKRCGTAGLELTLVEWGGFLFHAKPAAGVAVDGADFLQMYVRARDSDPVPNLYFYLVDTTDAESTPVVLGAEHMDRGAVDHLAWTRVRIPVAQLGLGLANLKKFVFSVRGSSSPAKLHVGAVQLVNPGASEPMTSDTFAAVVFDSCTGQASASPTPSPAAVASPTPSPSASASPTPATASPTPAPTPATGSPTPAPTPATGSPTPTSTPTSSSPEPTPSALDIDVLAFQPLAAPSSAAPLLTIRGRRFSAALQGSGGLSGSLFCVLVDRDNNRVMATGIVADDSTILCPLPSMSAGPKSVALMHAGREVFAFEQMFAVVEMSDRELCPDDARPLLCRVGAVACVAAFADCDAVCDASLVSCWDQTCVETSDECMPVPACPAALSVRCASGACVGMDQSCPEDVDGAERTAACEDATQTRCPDGRCHSGRCGAFNGCPAESPIRCPHGNCAAELAGCAAHCADADQIACFDGSCVDDWTSCAPVPATVKPRASSVIVDPALGQQTLAASVAQIIVPASAFAADASTTIAVDAVADSTLDAVRRPRNWLHATRGIRSPVLNVTVPDSVARPFRERVELHFNVKDVVLAAGDNSLDGLCLAFLDEAENAWQCAAGGVVAFDETAGVLTASIDHFTAVAIVDEPDEPESDADEDMDADRASESFIDKIMHFDSPLAYGVAAGAGLLVMGAFAAVLVVMRRRRASPAERQEQAVTVGRATLMQSNAIEMSRV